MTKIGPLRGLPASFHALSESTEACLRRLKSSSHQYLKKITAVRDVKIHATASNGYHQQKDGLFFLHNGLADSGCSKVNIISELLSVKYH